MNPKEIIWKDLKIGCGAKFRVYSNDYEDEEEAICGKDDTLCTFCYIKNENIKKVRLENLKEVKAMLVKFRRGDGQIHEDYNNLIRELEKLRGT